MGKLENLKKTAGAIAAESMGAGRTPAVTHGASAPVVAPAEGGRLKDVVRSKNAAEIPLARIVPDPGQPRETFEEESLARLAESLKTRGQLQPIRVRWDEAADRYVIVCGERRWRAAELAGLRTMTAIVMDGPAAPAELLALQCIENLAREDLRPIEQARAFRSLMDAYGWSTHQLAAELAIDQSNIVRAVKLLETHPAVQERVEQGTLSPSTAYEISKVADLEAEQDLAKRVVAKGMNRAETVEAVRQSAARTKGRGTSRGKAKGKPTRLAAELKYRGSRGIRLLVQSAARHTLTDVVADLEELVEQIRAQIETGGRDAA